VNTSTADRLAAALTEVVDARTLWVQHGDGTAQRPTCNVDRLDRSLAAYDDALVARVTEIVHTLPAGRLSHNHEPRATTGLNTALNYAVGIADEDDGA
jgi:hypothetical protein